MALCLCEHTKHFERGDAHEYQMAPAVLDVKTSMGHFFMCEQCARECHSKSPPYGYSTFPELGGYCLECKRDDGRHDTNCAAVN